MLKFKKIDPAHSYMVGPPWDSCTCIHYSCPRQGAGERPEGADRNCEDKRPARY